MEDVATLPLAIRPATDADAPGIIDLIARCYADYEGCVLDVEREEPGLLRPAEAFERFWVAVRGGRVVGTIAAARHGGNVELKKLYVAHSERGAGLGRRLIELVESWARETEAAAVELWTDTRFLTAHAVYARLGYRRTGRTRELHDLSNSSEFEFVKPSRAQ
jgi:putative acetyltransferase